MKKTNYPKGYKQKDMRSIALWGAIGLLIVLVIYALFFRDASVVSNLASTGQAAQSAASGGMVGGC
jgi:hypothetical protein